MSTAAKHDEFSVPRRPNQRATAGRSPRTSSYSQAEILEAIRAWHRTYGETPTMLDWTPAQARRVGQEWRAERFEAGSWPSTRVVCRQFETFNAAIAAAGFTPRSAPTRVASNLSGPEAITRAFIEWTRRYGDVPTMADWDPARARRLGQDWRIARYYQGDWPSARSVALHFGSFTQAAVAAGLASRPRGVHNEDRHTHRHANRIAVARNLAQQQTPGNESLAHSIRAVSQARKRQDPVAVHAALVDLAGTALAWAELFGSD
ncbi:MAG: hypothetical protein J2O48_06565 [Solirubrobacterales bacterium]|nr:hypothetical protein [Solirubrobacterales bacterium]